MSRRVDDEDEDGHEPVIVPIEDALDLHPFAPRDIPSVVESYLEAAQAAGFDEVRLIHGRGIGVQRRNVQEVLFILSDGRKGTKLLWWSLFQPVLM